MPDPNFEEFNRRIMAEFHANGGEIGGRLSGTDILILTSTGARTGQTRWHPVAYNKDRHRYVVVASKGGSSKSPDWYYNLVACPSAVIEVGTEVIPVEASVASGIERERLNAQHAAKMPQFLEYAKNTGRVVPVVVLTPKG